MDYAVISDAKMRGTLKETLLEVPPPAAVSDHTFCKVKQVPKFAKNEDADGVISTDACWRVSGESYPVVTKISFPRKGRDTFQLTADQEAYCWRLAAVLGDLDANTSTPVRAHLEKRLGLDPLTQYCNSENLRDLLQCINTDPRLSDSVRQKRVAAAYWSRLLRHTCAHRLFLPTFHRLILRDLLCAIIQLTHFTEDKKSRKLAFKILQVLKLKYRKKLPSLN